MKRETSRGHSNPRYCSEDNSLWYIGCFLNQLNYSSIKVKKKNVAFLLRADESEETDITNKQFGQSWVNNMRC